MVTAFDAALNLGTESSGRCGINLSQFKYPFEMVRNLTVGTFKYAQPL